MTRAMKMQTYTILTSLLAALVLAAGSAAAATSLELISCQKALESQIRGYSNILYTRITTCTQKVVDCKLADEIDTVDPTACLAAATTACGSAPTTVSEQLTLRKGKVQQRCGLIPLAEVEPFIGGLGFFGVAAGCSAVTTSDLVDCVFASSQCSTERQILRLDPRAQDSLTTAGVAASFPCVAP